MTDRPNYPARVVVVALALLWCAYFWWEVIATATVWLGLWTPGIEVMK